MIKTGLKKLFAWLLLSLITACGPSGASVPLTIYNYTGKGITAGVENGPADGASPYGGSGRMCCVNIPEVWRPGLKTTIIWSTESEDPTVDWGPDHKVEVAIPEYTARGAFQIHVLPQGEIKVFISPYTPGHESHPLYELREKNRELWKIYTAEKEKQYEAALQEMIEKEAQTTGVAK